MKAALLTAVRKPIEVVDIDVDLPRDAEVLVRTVAAGVCHSDLHILEGTQAFPVPAVLGHEAAGIVEATGPDVTDFKSGDEVVVCSSVFCGRCYQCLSGRPYICQNVPVRSLKHPPSLSVDGQKVEQFAYMGAHAELMLVHQNALVRIDQDIGLDKAALFGCAVTTGLGAVFNSAKVPVGSTVAVFGIGGIGTSVIQGARIAGASRIIAVDIEATKLDLALELGATDTIDSSSNDPVESVRQLTEGGVEYAFEAVGSKETAEQAYAATADCGICTVIGVLPDGVRMEIGWEGLFAEKTLQGTHMGSNRFRIDVPRYIDLYLDGRLKLGEMITRLGPLTEINEFYDALRNRVGVRSMITF